MDKLRLGHFRLHGGYVLGVSEEDSEGQTISWGLPMDDGSMFLGRAWIEHDILILSAWKGQREQRDTDPQWDQLPPWDQARYWLKMVDFGGVGGPWYVSTGEAVPAEEIGDAMLALGFHRFV